MNSPVTSQETGQGLIIRLSCISRISRLLDRLPAIRHTIGTPGRVAVTFDRGPGRLALIGLLSDPVPYTRDRANEPGVASHARSSSIGNHSLADFPVLIVMR